MKSIKIGFAPTRRSIFSAPDAIKYANLTRERLKELGVEFVDITDINEEGLFYDEADREKIEAKFRAEEVKGIFFPHGNFGTEYVCARLARDMGLPVLLWGPRDERPDENGVRLRDSQCGLFATGKVLRRFQVPFTYMTNCRLTDPEFERGIRDFLAVCNVVDVFRHTRILQIAPRPFDFWSTMCNEGELLEKFNIQLSPIPMPELTSEIKKVKAEKTEVENVITYCNTNMCVAIKPEQLENVAALKVAMKNLAAKYGCNAIAIQCWNALQDEIGIMPCAANSLLNEEGIPVVCETDIHGAITALMVEAAGMDTARSFFADWTVRHPDNENGELLQHCGPWPISVAQEKPTIGYPLAFDHPGAVEAQAKLGEMTLARFDGDNGEYSLLLGNAKGVEGPYTKGTYVWVEVANLKRLEAKIVEGPYIYKLTEEHAFKTDYSNASRTQLFNLETLKWDEKLCEMFGIPECALPVVCDSDSLFGYTTLEGFFEEPVPIHAALGDSHGALFGQGCHSVGMIKATYGTGSSLMMNIGEKPVFSTHGIATSLAWKMGEKAEYVLEGNLNYTGAVITWLKDDLQMIAAPAESGTLAESANQEDRTYLVPAFSGLGAPYWDSDAVATYYGMTRTTGRAELVKAALESIAYQINDLVVAMEQDTGLEISEVRVDGGPTHNGYLMQFQSDIFQKQVAIPEYEELSGIGAAYAAGIAVGMYNKESLFANAERKIYAPKMPTELRDLKYAGWKEVVGKVLTKK